MKPRTQVFRWSTVVKPGDGYRGKPLLSLNIGRKFNSRKSKTLCCGSRSWNSSNESGITEHETRGRRLKSTSKVDQSLSLMFVSYYGRTFTSREIPTRNCALLLCMENPILSSSSSWHFNYSFITGTKDYLNECGVRYIERKHYISMWYMNTIVNRSVQIFKTSFWSMTSKN